MLLLLLVTVMCHHLLQYRPDECGNEIRWADFCLLLHKDPQPAVNHHVAVQGINQGMLPDAALASAATCLSLAAFVTSVVYLHK